MAKECLGTVRAFVSRQGPGRDGETTLFVASTQSRGEDLLDRTKAHLARATSFYHSADAHGLCAKWSDVLQSALRLQRERGVGVATEDADVVMGHVMTVRAYALSMGGDRASGVSDGDSRRSFARLLASSMLTQAVTLRFHSISLFR